MFGFNKKLKEYASYSTDMNYLNSKKSDLENYLKTKEELYNSLCEIDGDLRNLRNQVQAKQREFIGSANIEVMQKHMELIKSLEELFKISIARFIFEECNDKSARYHVLVSNIILKYQKEFLYLKAKYKELEGIEFFDIDYEIDKFYNYIKQVYYEFMATEYQYGLDKNSFRR